MSKQDDLDTLAEMVAAEIAQHGPPGPHHGLSCPMYQPHDGPRINVATKSYRDGYDRIFGRKPEDRSTN